MNIYEIIYDDIPDFFADFARTTKTHSAQGFDDFGNFQWKGVFNVRKLSRTEQEDLKRLRKELDEFDEMYGSNIAEKNKDAVYQATLRKVQQLEAGTAPRKPKYWKAPAQKPAPKAKPRQAGKPTSVFGSLKQLEPWNMFDLPLKPGTTLPKPPRGRGRPSKKPKPFTPAVTLFPTVPKRVGTRLVPAKTLDVTHYEIR